MSSIQLLIDTMQRAANPKYAIQQKAYMRNQFEFLGIPSPQRKSLFSNFWKSIEKPTFSIAKQWAEILWEKEEREYQYVAIDLLMKYEKKWPEAELSFIEWLILQKSWWDTVDLIASHFAGNYFLSYPQHHENTIKKWIHSNPLWLQRSAIIHQLSYKEKTHTSLLEESIVTYQDTEEFFLAKAMGWALRQYAKTDRAFVVRLLNTHKLPNLTQKEATKNFEKHL